MAIGKAWALLKNLPAQNPAAAVFGALLTAAALYVVVTFLIWIAYRIPGLPGVAPDLAKSIGVSTPQLLEFKCHSCRRRIRRHPTVGDAPPGRGRGGNRSGGDADSGINGK